MFHREPGYAFQHFLVQAAIYHTLLRRQRLQMHLRAAQIIEASERWNTASKAEMLAYHYARSANPAAAIPHLLEAADRAIRRYALERARGHYERLLKLVDAHDERYKETNIRIHTGLGQTLKLLGEYSEARRHLEIGLEQLTPWEEAGQNREFRQVLVHTIRELADIEQRESRFPAAIDLLNAGLDALGEGGRQRFPDMWRLLKERLAFVHFRQGQLDQALAVAQSALLSTGHSLPDPVNQARLFNTLAGVFWQSGRIDEAITYVNHSLEQHQAIGNAWEKSVAYNNLGILYVLHDKWKQANNS
jgi:predicted ATPase